jgi:O-antigen/teichoic acid export membrane protein
MLRLAIKDSLVYGAAGIATRAMGLLLLPVYSRILSPSEYGLFDLVMAAAAIASIAVPLEISLGLARLYPDAASEGQKRRFATTAWLFTLSMYGIFSLLAVALYLAGTVPRLRTVSLPLVGLGLAYIVLMGLLYFLQNQLRWELKGLNYAKVNLFNAYGGGALAALLGWYFGLTGVLIGLCIGVASAIILARLYVGDSLRGAWDSEKLRAMLQYALPLVPASLSALVTLYVDRALLSYFSGLHDVGLFALGYRVASISLLGLVGIQGALIPLIYSHHKAARTPADIARLFRWFTGVSILLCGFLGLFAAEMLQVLVAQSFRDASKIVVILAPACVLMQLYIFFPGMFLEKKTWLQLGVQVAAAMANFSLCLWLIPTYGFVGAAVGNLLAAALFCVIWGSISQDNYPIPFEWKTLVYGLVLYAVVVATGQWISADFWPGVAIKLGLFGGLALGLHLFGFARGNEWAILIARLGSRLKRA